MLKIGALIYPDFELLDLFGPMEMFGTMPDEFQLQLVAAEAGPVKSSGQLMAHADLSVKDGHEFDVLFLPGGIGTREMIRDQEMLDWIRKAGDAADHVLTVCTGSGIIAKAGLLDGHRATTNKMAFGWVEKMGPEVQWVKQARWVVDGKFRTSSGVSAGMDMALDFVADLHGRDRAEEVAMWAEYEWHQDASRDPFAKLHGLV